MCFEFSFNLIGRLNMALVLTGQSWRVLKSWYTGGTHSKDFGAFSDTNLTRSLFPSVAQASRLINFDVGSLPLIESFSFRLQTGVHFIKTERVGKSKMFRFNSAVQ